MTKKRVQSTESAQPTMGGKHVNKQLPYVTPDVHRKVCGWQQGEQRVKEIPSWALHPANLNS